MPLSLASARWLAAEVNRQREMGRDVIADMAATKQRRRIDADTRAYTFPAAARQFIDEHARKNNRGWRESPRLFGVDYRKDDGEPKEIKGSLACAGGTARSARSPATTCTPPLTRPGGRASLAWTRATRVLATQEVAQSPGTRQAFRVAASAPQVDRRSLPRHVRPPPSAKRARRLSDDESEHSGKQRRTRLSVRRTFRLLLLTGCRRDEVAG